MELNKIYNEDCLETMKRMPDKSVDLTITSPPYNMNLRISNGKYISRQIVASEFASKYHGFDDNLPIDEFYDLHSKILKEIVRVSKITFYNFQLVTGSKRAFFKIIGEFNEDIKDVIVWDKINSQPAMRDKVLNSQHEFILILGDNPISRRFTKCNFERGTLSNLWNIKRDRSKNSKHGAVFPSELVKNVILNFTDEDDVIYDPFSGTGTTAETAKVLGRKYIGSEISAEYFRESENRISSLLF